MLHTHFFEANTKFSSEKECIDVIPTFICLVSPVRKCCFVNKGVECSEKA